MEIEESARLLFFKYALPCADTLIGRGIIGKEEVERICDYVRKETVPREKYENLFKTAIAHLTLIAKELKKKTIDTETIHEYFIFRHNDVVDENGTMQNTAACKTYYGPVKKIEKNNAVVETPLGNQRYRCDFAPDLQLKDIVIVHRGYVVEKVDEDLLVKIKKENK